MKSIKDATKSYYQQASLNDDAMDRFSSMLEEEKPKAGFQFRPQLVAACLLVVVSLAIFLVPSSPQTVEMAIAKEVVKNHIKMKPLEIESNDLGALRKYFTQLDFFLIQSQRYDIGNMLGARYCSIQGVTAAQMRYQSPIDDGANVISVYEVEYDPQLFGDIPSLDQGLAPKEIILNGLSVKLWVEKGLLMVSVAEV